MFPLFWYTEQALASFTDYWIWIVLGIPVAIAVVMYLTKKHPKGMGPIAVGTGVLLLIIPFLSPLLVNYEAANLEFLPDFAFALDCLMLAAMVSTPFLLVAETNRIEYRPTTRCCAIGTWALALVPSRLGALAGKPGFFLGVGIAVGATILAVIGLFPDVLDILHEEIAARVRYPSDPTARAPGALIPVVCSEGAAKKDENKKGKYYLGIALVTQGPALPLVKDVQLVKESKPLDLSWLVAFLKRRPLAWYPEVFGVEISCDGNAAQYGFFARGSSQEDALRKALAIKQRLEANCEGLECMAFTRPVTGELLGRGYRLHEVRLPRGFYKKLSFLDQWGTLLAQRKIPVQLFITFQEVRQMRQKMLRNYANLALATKLPVTARATSEHVDSQALLNTWGTDNIDPIFRVQLHIYPRLATSTEATDFRASMAAFRASFRNLDSRVMTVSPASYTAWGRVLKLRHVRGRETTPKALDFGFPLSIPLHRGRLFPGEKFHPVPSLTRETSDRILIGTRVAHGRRTEQMYGFLINNLKRHLLVLGIPGTGKTFLLSSIVQQLRAKAPRAGIIVINIAKADQEHFYGVPPENVFRAHTPRFQMPYFCYPLAEMADMNKFLEQSAKSLALAMALGGWDLPYKKLVEALTGSITQCQQVPDTLEALFGLFESALRSRDYGSAQAKIVTSIMNRVDYLRGARELLQAAQVLPPGMRPEWLDRATRGELVYLDFYPASDDERFFYLFILYNILDTFTQQYSPTEGEPLRLGVVIDESHTITSWSPANMAGQDALPPQGAEVNRVFRKHLTEDRSRGIGYIIADQQVAGLPESAFEIPAIQLFFTVGRATSQAITPNPEEQALLTLLEERRAVIHDATETPKHFLAHMLDVTLPPQKSSQPALPPASPDFTHVEELAAETPETIDPCILEPRVQTHLRAHATALATQGNLEGAFKSLWLLAYNEVFKLFPAGHAPAPGTPLQMLLVRLEVIARPDSCLPAPIAADLDARLETVADIYTRGSKGQLRPGDIPTFDQYMHTIARAYRSLLAPPEIHEPTKPTPESLIAPLPIAGPSEDISEVEIIANWRAWRPECITPRSIQVWRARVLALTEEGNAADAFAITFFLWHHLFRRLVDGANSPPTEVNFRLLGKPVCDSFIGAKDLPVGRDFLTLCDRVEDWSKKLIAKALPTSPDTAAAIREIFLDLERTYLQAIAS